MQNQDDRLLRILLSIDEFFQHISLICGEQFDFAHVDAFKEYVEELCRNLSFQTYQREKSTVYGFFCQQKVQLSARFRCQFARYKEIRDLARYFFSEDQAQQALQDFPGWRFEDFVINMLSALNEFLQSSLLLRGKSTEALTAALKSFFVKPPISFEPAPTEQFVHEQQGAQSDIFCNLFNELYRPEVFCLTSYDVVQELSEMQRYIRKHYGSESLAQLLGNLLLRPQMCDCQFYISNLIQSTAVQQAVECSGLKASTAHNDWNETEMGCEALLRGVCVLRQYLRAEIRKLDAQAVCDKAGVLQLLDENRRLKEKSIDGSAALEATRLVPRKCAVTTEIQAGGSQETQTDLQLSASAVQTDPIQAAEADPGGQLQSVRMLAIQQQLQLILTQNQEVLICLQRLDQRVCSIEKRLM